MNKYVQKQVEIREKAEEEEKRKTEKKFETMMKDGSNGFWKERKNLQRDETGDWIVMKNKDGRRIFDPDENKEIIASHYENLYSEGNAPVHPHHSLVKEKISAWTNIDMEEEEKEIDKMPTKKEVYEAIRNKKNGKATTDWKNEILKKGGEPMIDVIMPVIKAFWTEEKSPKQWNEGRITSIWKGKGDREKMDNQRGVTVSSGVGTIPEEILTQRLMKTIEFSQAQAGGRKGGSTTDHIFIIKGLINLAIEKGDDLIVTFFDIKKAYDRADMGDMLHIIHEQGFRGKVWRLTKSANENLTARVKTKAGITREIQRKKGGKQGGKLMVPLFAKMMDCLPESMHKDSELGVNYGRVKVAGIVYVDDVATMAKNYEQQELTLNAVNEFALKHQLEWGEDKCKVMEIGSHKEKRSEWKLGNKTIKTCKTYTYLGEIISRDGTNTENLGERLSKIKRTVREIINCGRSKVMRKIESGVYLKLHEAVTIPTLLSASETWTISSKEYEEINKMELWALKTMFGLPPTTPTPAIIYATGTLYAEIRIKKRQLMYLYKLLNKENDHWAKEMLEVLRQNKTSWVKNINKILELWELELEWCSIKEKTLNQWKVEVNQAAEKINKEKLKAACHSKERGKIRQKTKTRTIIEKIDNPDYTRKPLAIINNLSALETRAMLMGRYGMLDCKANYSMGYGGKECGQCMVVDDVDHRVNWCGNYKHSNLCESQTKIDMEMLYCDDIEKIRPIIVRILSMWDLEHGKNSMK